MSERTFAALAGLVAGAGALASPPVAYHFDRVGDGPMNGRDGWGATAEAYGIAEAAFDGGVAAHSVASIGAAASRENNDAWSFPTFTRAQTRAALGIDFKVEDPAEWASFAFTIANPDNGWSNEERVGVGYYPGFNHLLLQRLDGWAFAGGASNFADHPGDWFRVELHIDSTAYGGNGSASVFYKNLTDGDTQFTPVGTLQNLGLGLAGKSWEVDPAEWTRIDLQFRNVAVDRVAFAVDCRADMNGDDALNVFDFLAFQTACGDGDPAADFSEDDRLNVFDFLAFQTAFGEGC